MFRACICIYTVQVAIYLTIYIYNTSKQLYMELMPCLIEGTYKIVGWAMSMHAKELCMFEYTCSYI